MSSSMTRVAVAQVDVPLAAVFSRKPMLGEPMNTVGEAGLVATTDARDWLREEVEQLREEVRAAQIDYMRAKLVPIIHACRDWGVELLVFPEYSVPAELLAELAACSDVMTIVAGSHSVERRNRGIYLQLGVDVDAQPKPGMTVAPVLTGGRLVALVAKLSSSRLDRDLCLGDDWAPVEVPELGNLGVLLCQDFLYRERTIHRERVGPGLDHTTLLAVPGFSQAHEQREFEAHSFEMSRRYGQPVLYANAPGEGGSTVHADLGEHELPAFPEGPGRLAACEEGVVVVDLDLGTRAPGSSTRYAGGPMLRSVAAASLILRHLPCLARYAALAERWAAQTRGEDWSLDELLADVATNVPLLREVIAVQSSSARAQRLSRLLGEREYIVEREQLRVFLREIPLPAELLPNSEFGQALDQGCRERLYAAAVRRRDNLPAELQQRPTAASSVRERGWTEAAMAQLHTVVEIIADERANIDRIPVEVPIGNYTRNVEELQLVFRTSPEHLLNFEPKSVQGVLFIGSGPGDGNHLRTGRWSLPDCSAIRDLWFSAWAQDQTATIIGVLDDLTRPPGMFVSFDPNFQFFEPNGALLLTYPEHGRRKLVAAAWSPGAHWLTTHRQRICAALQLVCAGIDDIEFLSAEQHEQHVVSMLQRFRHASTPIQRFVEAKLREVGQQFVAPNITTRGDSQLALGELSKWLISNEPIGLLFGSFGSGKSTVTAVWAQQRWTETDSGPRPVFVNLAGRFGHHPMQMLVAAAGGDHHQVRDLQAMCLLVEHGLLFPIFDGIDELATSMTERDLSEAVFALAAIAGPRGKVLISLRDHVFRSEQRRQYVINAALQEARSGGAREMVLERFGPAQIDELLARTVTAEERELIRRRMTEIYELEDLARTPLLLAMIISTRSVLADVATLNSAALYSAYVDRWLSQAETDTREILSRTQKQAFAETLAAAIWAGDQPSCSWAQLQQSAIELQFHTSDLAAATTAEGLFSELQGASFFVHEQSDHFRFAHKSFLEYFMARVVVRGLRSDPASALATRPLSAEISRFVHELVDDDGKQMFGRLRRWLSRARSSGAELRAVTNALRLLRDDLRFGGSILEWIPACLDLRDVDLRGEDLSELDLRGARLDGADLRSVNFDRAVLDRCDFTGADLSGATLRGARAHAANFTTASLRGVVACGIELDDATLIRADLRCSTWFPHSTTGVRIDDARTGPTVGSAFANTATPPRPRLLEDHATPILGLCASPDGRRLASADALGQVRIRELEGNSLEAMFTLDSACRALSWSSSAELLACGTDTGQTVVLDLDRGAIVHRMPASSQKVIKLEWSPGGTMLARIDVGGHVDVLEPASSRVRTFDEAWTSFAWLDEDTTLLLMSPNELRLVGLDEDRTIMSLAGPGTSPVVGCRTAAPGEFVVGAGTSLTRYVIGEPTPLSTMHTDGIIRCLCSRPSGSSYAVSIANGRGGYELRHGHDDRLLQHVDGGSIHVLVPCEREQWAALGPEELRVGSGPTTRRWRMPNPGYRVTWSADGKDLIVASRESSWLVWHTTTLGEPSPIPERNELLSGRAASSTSSADGRWTAGWTRARGLWCEHTETAEPIDLPQPFEHVMDLAWSPHDDRLACVHVDGSVTITRPSQPELVIHLAHREQHTLISAGASAYWSAPAHRSRLRLEVTSSDGRARWYLPLPSDWPASTNEAALLERLAPRR